MSDKEKPSEGSAFQTDSTEVITERPRWKKDEGGNKGLRTVQETNHLRFFEANQFWFFYTYDRKPVLLSLHRGMAWSDFVLKDHPG